MKTLLALTVLTLTCFLKHSSANPAAIGMLTNDVECCEAVTNKMYIPVHKVQHVTMTSGCSREAIIVTTLKKKKFCLDPEWKHAQMHLEEFKQRSAPTTLKPETTKEMKKNFSSTTLKPTTT
ncbi:Fc receptor-like protein [Sarotherodon galilaeus]